MSLQLLWILCIITKSLNRTMSFPSLRKQREKKENKKMPCVFIFNKQMINSNKENYSLRKVLVLLSVFA